MASDNNGAFIHRCSICSRALTNPRSIQLGIGPVCRRKGNFQMDFVENLSDDVIDIPFDPKTKDILCHRDTDDGMKAHFNIRQVIMKHSPTGMAWGYLGSGPSDFAINILLHFLPKDQAMNPNIYQAFKEKFVATIPPDGGIIHGKDISAWCENSVEELVYGER